MKHYKMSDVVIEITDRENNPSKSIYKKFVGLEHYVSGEATIKNYGNAEKLESTMKIFQSGDILVARRNVYLRRAAMVDFDGLTSGDSIVLRAKDKTIGRLLPFILNTDEFWSFADQYADGTMSKRLSPKTLMKYEFDLPDEDEQKKLADMLWAATETKESYQELLRQTDELVKSQFIEMFGDPNSNTENWPIKTLNDIAESFIGLTYKPESIAPDGVIVLRSSNIQETTLSLEDQVRVKTAVKEKLFVQENDILMCSRNGSSSLVGKVAKIPKLNEKMTFGAFMTVIRSKEYSDYLFVYFQLPSFRKQVNTGTATINQITQSMLAKVELPVPPVEKVEAFSEVLKQTDKSKYIEHYASKRILVGGECCA